MSTFTVPQPSQLRAPKTRADEKPVVAPVETAPVAHKSIQEILKITIPLTMLATFVGTVLFVVLAGGLLGEAVGYGAYMAFWIGGGFGAILSGAYYNHVTGGLAEGH